MLSHGIDSVRVLSVSEVAHLLRLSALTMYRSIRRGDLPAVRLSSHGAPPVPRHAIAFPARAPRTLAGAVEAPAHGAGAA